MQETNKSDLSGSADFSNEFNLYNPDETRKAANILRAMNHKLRRNILSFIDKKQKTNVTEIYTAMEIEQSVASQHLAILRRAKIVSTSRIGKQIIYSVNYDRIAQYSKNVKELLA